MGNEELFTIENIVLAFAGFVCLFLMIQLVYKFTGFNPFVTTKRAELTRREKEKLFKENLESRYKKIVYRIIDFKQKYRLFGLDEFTRESKETILRRTEQRLLPDDTNYMTIEEWDAVHTLASIVVIPIFIILLFFVPANIRFFALPILIIIEICINWGHFFLLKQDVEAQNKRMSAAFGDFYLTQHNILKNEKSHPFSKGLKIYRDAAKDEFMKNWADTTLNLIAQTTEEKVIEDYQMMYRDLPVMTKLLRLENDIIKGSGSDTVNELNGMRAQILAQKERGIKDTSQILLMKASIAIRTVWFIFAQTAIGFIVMSILSGGL